LLPAAGHSGGAALPENEPAAEPREELDWYDRIGERVKVFVRGWRRVDAWALKPLSTERAWGWQLLAPAEYPFFVPALALLLVVAVTVGPNLRFGPVTLGLLGLGLLLLLLLHARALHSPRLRVRLLAGYLGILLLLGGLLVAVAVRFRPETFYPDSSLRLHAGPAIALALALALWPASAIAGHIVKRVPNDVMASSLPAVELFQPKSRYDYRGDTPGLALVSIFLLVPIRYPVQLLLPAALAALVLPSRWLHEACGLLLALTWVALFLGVLFDRLMEILNTLGRLFFIGPQRILSVVVIAVAIARVAGVHYFTYLFDAPNGNSTIFLYVFFAYAVAWFYGFWCEILLARRFIRLLTERKERLASVDYAFEGSPTVSRVLNGGRTISLHGAGRLIVSGTYDPDYDRQYRHRRDPSDAARTALAFLTPAEVLAEFRTQLEDRGWTGSDRDPLPRVRDLQRAVFVFPGITGLLVIAFLGLPLGFSHFLAAQPPELDVVLDDHINLRLQPLLLGDGRAFAATGRQDACGPLGADDRRIAFAASGGGSRAAIYTASVLRALAEQNRICNLVHASGVSGGSAALAYFALNQDRLRVPRDRFDPEAWDEFEAAMAEPYIKKVLESASDSAVVFGTWRWRNSVCGEKAPRDERRGGWHPTRVRYGNLLAESFVCEMGNGSMGSVRFGLVLNTGVIGRFLPNEPSDVPLHERARLAAGDPIRASDVAGGRLVLTNVPQPHAAQRQAAGQGTGTRDLHFFSINDPQMSVARAAALSANFPPVFSDAAIDERDVPTGKHDKRFWVTDGGTVENRGVVPLYLSIDDALNGRDLAEKGLGDEHAAIERLLGRDPWPELHVVIADVSTVGGPYKESYGLQSVRSAGGQMGLALEAELLEDLQALYERHGSSVTVHELPMPAVLRDGIGTHWMIPSRLDFANPEDEDDRRSLSTEEVLGLVRGLFAPEAVPEGDAGAVQDWTCFVPDKPADLASTGKPTREAPPHAEAWAALTEALGVPRTNPCVREQVAGAR
jgi:hypothetical protein